MNGTTDIATNVAAELAKQIPLKDAYEDALSPAMKQTGEAFEDTVKTIRLVLAPLQLGAALQDRFVGFLNKSVRGIPDERRIPPPKQILGPTLEAIRYEDDGSRLDDMFAALLNKSMDAENAHLAHPAFPILIRQLSPDEAILLNEIFRFQESGTTAKRRYTMDLKREMPRAWENVRFEIDEISQDSLQFPSNLPFYLQHLYSMGLASTFKIDEQPIMDKNVQTGLRVFDEYKLTEFGVSFMRAVSPNSK
ncbi:DUF4393 domain-containing protein [Agrobacterium tumefaciens]|uniref:DUF4393 domain-containing protein n=1 Tax=Agrobacterium tumefaciens TaxID=358 RepID=UPI00157327DF|nr:DUF4393 domain-containing protein [Agrobacterium tumefaciens]WHO22640.1 DUF4393 domain-containing protein [Agrobacterium tumefaciens]